MSIHTGFLTNELTNSGTEIPANKIPIASLVFCFAMLLNAFVLQVRADDPQTKQSVENKSATLPQIEWSVQSDKPVIPLGFQGKLDQRRAGCCSVHRFGDKYRMFYWGEDADGKNAILGAESPVDDPMAFKPLGVVLGRQPESKHNNIGPCFAQIVPRDDGPWLMYVCTANNGKAPDRWATYIAISEDKGETWKYHTDEPMLPKTRSWNKTATGSVCVLREKDKWRAYYTSFGDKGLDWVGIGYAESKNGIDWTYPIDRLVVEPRNKEVDPTETLLSKPWVIKEEGGYRMWVGARNVAYRLRCLTSTDGINWKWETDGKYYDDGRLLGGAGKKGSFDDRMRSYASVLREGDEYLLWYTGNNYGRAGIGFAKGKRVGSTDQQSQRDNAKDKNIEAQKLRIALVGDSTVTEEHGWGGAFAKLLSSKAECVNLARAGRSSKSYRDEGHWKNFVKQKSDYVLIQFGHNDQRTTAKHNADPKTTFRENITRYVEGALQTGSKPILVTPMARRKFADNGKIESDLENYAQAVRDVATEKNIPLIDLHALSIAHMNKIGREAANSYAPPSKNNEPDRTHLNTIGAKAIAEIVAEELCKIEPALASYVQPQSH